MTRFFLIRHATNDTVGKLLAGRKKGVELNQSGLQQANEIAQRLRQVRLDAIYSSPLERAVQSAKPLAASNGLSINISSYFLEVDFGDWTGKSFEDLKNDKQFSLFNTFRSVTRIPNGETMLEAQQRIVSGLTNVAQEFPSGNVAIVSHADMIKAAIAWFAGIHLDLFQRIEISPSSISIIDLFPETARIFLLNHQGSIEM